MGASMPYETNLNEGPLSGAAKAPAYERQGCKLAETGRSGLEQEVRVSGP